MKTLLRVTITAIAIALVSPIYASRSEAKFLKRIKKQYEEKAESGQALTFIDEDKYNVPEGKELVQIMIMRHGKPLVKKKKFYSWKEADAYTKEYDKVGVEAFSPDKIVIPEGIDTIYTSNLPRSINTGEYISKGKIAIASDKKFREFERAVPHISGIKMPLHFWSVTARVPWIFGKGNIESLSGAKKRSNEVSSFLQQKAMKKKRVFLVAHGFLNKFTGKRLKKDGWVRVKNGGHKHLGVSLYVKLVDKKPQQ